MADIFQDLPIKAPIAKVFEAISTPTGLDQWWTDKSSGKPALGVEYKLQFGPEYDWRAIVTKCVPPREFELQITRSDGDWKNTRVGFGLELKEGLTWVGFYHSQWPEPNEHFRVSSHCWALYLRILRRYLEQGETVPYAARLQA